MIRRKKRPSKFDKNQNYRKSRELEKIAKRFRNELLDLETPAEVLFKSYLIELKMRYEFQKIIYVGRSFYIVDFYLPKKAIVIEVDGKQHYEEEGIIADSNRTINLKLQGIKEVYRFTNDEVFNKDSCIKRLFTILYEKDFKKIVKKSVVNRS